MNLLSQLHGAIHIPDNELIPWHDRNIHMHRHYSPSLKETTLTLFTKDHKKVVKITDKDHEEIPDETEKNNWCLYRKREWQKELMAMYQGLGD